jgi:hypothetical protein
VPDTYDRQQVLDAIAAAWGAYWSRIQALPREALLTPTDAAGWNARDHIDHLRAWEASITTAITKGNRHEGMGVSAEEYAAGDIDRLNDRIRATNAGVSLEEVLAMAEAGHAAFLGALRSLPADGLQRTYGSYIRDAPDDRRDEPFALRVLGNSAEHYPEHLEYIERIVGQHPGV